MEVRKSVVDELFITKVLEVALCKKPTVYLSCNYLADRRKSKIMADIWLLISDYI